MVMLSTSYQAAISQLEAMFVAEISPSAEECTVRISRRKYTEKKVHNGTIFETKSKPLKSFRKNLRYVQIDC